jgi:hypothetical protein
MKKIRKQLAIFILSMLAMALITGCSTDNDEPQTPEDSFGKAVEFTEIRLEDLPLDIKVQAESLLLTRGYYRWSTEDGTEFLLVSSGEKPTGGYGIQIISLADHQGVYKALIGEGKPGADAVVPQVITYPHVIITFTGDLKIDEVVNEVGEAFDLYDAPTVKLESVTGEYQGQIDNTSIEVKTGDQYRVFRNYEFESLLKEIETGDEVTIEYIVNDEGQNILYTIKK